MTESEAKRRFGGGCAVFGAALHGNGCCYVGGKR
jgi:hypothetical protein